jgi:phenylalanyl-tRNA synthetase beta chain
MKFTLSWLREHLETSADLETITTTLSSIGLEVEGVEDRAAKLAPFRTARILEAVQHPNADRLRACRVDTGEGAPVSVVCGAPNARTGLHVVFAPPGAFIPGSGITLKVGEIRGVTSAGMLVSFREMALGDDHEGIVELPEGTPVGVPYAQFAQLDDPVIEIGVTPNRGDALSVRGIARDLAAAGLGVLKPWEAPAIPAKFETPVGWRIEWPEACPYILGRSVRGVRNGPSPDWLKRKLVSVGLRPISALVDVTNYFTVALGRPLHVFDADRIAGYTLTARRGAGETFRALNGRDVTVGGEDPVLADETSVVSLAGIIGGEATGSQLETTHAFIECALFDPVIVARAGRRHKISTDARQRFERGIDPALLPRAIEAATAMILDLCGGEPGTVVSAGAEPAWQRQAAMRFERIAGLGGAAISAEDAAGILERLGFDTAEIDAQRIVVNVPSWRNDIVGIADFSRNDIAGLPGLDQSPTLDPARARQAAEGAAAIEPECDLLEEVLRIRGLDTIPAVSLPVSSIVPPPALAPRQVRTAMARRLLAGRGLAECVTYSFVSQAEAARFGGTDSSLTLKNPIAADLDQMRPTPLASLAQAAGREAARGAGQAALSEIGPGYHPEGQFLIAAGLRMGAPTRHWSAGPPAADAIVAKGDVWALLAALGVPMEALSVTPDAPAHYHPGQSGVIRQGPRMVLAQFGALHPSVITALGLEAPVCGFELFLDAVADPKRRKRAAPVLPSLQPVLRDFAFVVASETKAETVLRAARSAERNLIAAVRLFDVFEGPTIAPGHKSLGVEVVFQPTERTLTDPEIEAASAKVVEAVVKSCGAKLR